MTRTDKLTGKRFKCYWISYKLTNAFKKSKHKLRNIQCRDSTHIYWSLVPCVSSDLPLCGCLCHPLYHHHHTQTVAGTVCRILPSLICYSFTLHQDFLLRIWCTSLGNLHKKQKGVNFNFKQKVCVYFKLYLNWASKFMQKHLFHLYRPSR